MARYNNPGWKNNTSPPISKENLDAISNTLEKSQLLTGDTDPTSLTIGAVGQIYYNTTTEQNWQCVSADYGLYTWNKISVKSKTILRTLSEDSWVNRTQTVSIQDITSDSNGFADIANTATSEQVIAAKNGLIAIAGQGDGTLTFSANGTVPTVDIPIIVVLIG